MKRWPRSFGRDEIHLWVCSGILSAELDHHLDWIAPGERERARRFRFEEDRRRYLGGVLLQRFALANFLSCSLRDVSFSRNRWGKPSLDESHESSIRFSLSRSHQVALLAVCESEEVGADLEYGLGRASGDLGMKRHFSRKEQKFIDNARDAGEAFFEIWARKEAYIKGIGRGLSHPLDGFDITPDKAGGSGLVRDWSSDSPSQPWHVQSVVLSPAGYGAAIATPLVSPSVRLMEIACDELLETIRG